LRICNARQSGAASHSAQFPGTNEESGRLVIVLNSGTFLAQRCVFAELGSNLRMRNLEGGPPPHPARLRSPSTDEGSGCLVNVLNTGVFGPALRIRRFRAPFCEYVMRGSPPPHPALLAFPNIKQAYDVTVFIATRRNSEGPGSNLVYWRSHFASAQCKTLNRRILRHSCSQTSSRCIWSR